MRIIPVLDLKGRVVVHAIAGRRDEYRPIESVLGPAQDALGLARAIREQFGLDWFYVADLDALRGQAQPAMDIYGTLADDGFRVMLDAGVARAAEARAVLEAGASDIVVALETLGAASELAAIVESLGAERVVFSLDMKDGVLLGGPPEWQKERPLNVALSAIDLGLRRLILLDLASVGTSSGCPTRDLVAEILRASPGQEIEIHTGGGIRSASDLEDLAASGASGALIATALHNGVLERSTLENWL